MAHRNQAQRPADRRGWRPLAALSLAAAAALMPPVLAAPLGQFQSFDQGPAGYAGNVIISGPDGRLWFTDNQNNTIRAISADGTVRSYPVPTDSSQSSGAGLFALAAGPDGAIWFTGFYSNVIGRVSASGEVRTYPLPLAKAMPYGIAAGPDGNLWFTLDAANGIGRITPAGVITLFPIPTPGATGGSTVVVSSKCVFCAFAITAGPQRSLWFTLPSARRIGRITLDGRVSTIPIQGVSAPSQDRSTPSLGAITATADGHLWFTQNIDKRISRMTPAGVVTSYSVAEQATSITPGPGSSVWFNQTPWTSPTTPAPAQGAAIGRLQPSATGRPQISTYAVPTPYSFPSAVATGADGSVWFTNIVEPSTSSIKLQLARVGTGVGPILTAQISGSPRVGSRLRCNSSDSSGWPVAERRYSWRLDGRLIAGSGGATYVPRAPGLVSCEVATSYQPALQVLSAASSAVRVAAR